jgi:hypothetical protein
MNSHKTLIMLGSWEQRCTLGLERILAAKQADRVVMYYLEEYAARTLPNREKAEYICSNHGVDITEHVLSFEEPAESWQILERDLLTESKLSEEVLLDITTMTRETIFQILHFLRLRKKAFKYIYHRPQQYDSEWLSRDPGVPRLIFKMSGISEPGRPTEMAILTGFDRERTQQLMEYFEPSRTLLAVQTGQQFENEKQNIAKHRERYGVDTARVSIVETDAYSLDHGVAVLSGHLRPITERANLIVSSLGPKLSAIALYQLHLSMPSLALAYAPSKEYNIKYSEGIGDSIEGVLNFG